MTPVQYRGDLLAQSQEWTNLYDDELKRRAVRAAAEQDIPVLVHRQPIRVSVHR